MMNKKEHRASILLVDDTPINLQLLIKALKEEHYTVRTAINGFLALESARSLCPDLVLLDINMPGMDGYEVCRRLKADPLTRDVPVIFISSMGETLDKIKAFEAGGVDYISKPFQTEEVLVRIGSHLAMRQTQLRLQQEIRDRQKIQGEFAEHKQNLEQLVAERTRELQEKNRSLLDEIEFRTEMEQALVESEQRYLFLVEEGFDGIFVHRDFKITYVNQQLLQMLGYREEEMLGKNPYAFICEEFVASVKEKTAAGNSAIIEFNLKKKAGGVLQVESFATGCTFGGEPARIGAIRDISERKQAEAELRLSEQNYASLFHQFESLLDAISDPLVLLTAKMEPLWTNSAYDRLCAVFDCDPINGMGMFQLGDNEQESPLLSCLRSGQVTEAQMTTPDRRVWGVKAFPMQDKEQQLEQVIVVAVDMTEKLRLREEANRSSRLASLGELAAGIAHEINNPNAVVLLNTPILKDVFADAEKVLGEYFQAHGQLTLAGIDYREMQIEVPSLIDRVQESAERIKRIVEDLKNFVRDEDPRDLTEVDLNLVVNAAVRLLSNNIQKATRNFQLELTDNLPKVKGNFQKLEQVVVNLIQNACQALTASDQVIRVVTFFDQQQNQVKIKVVDQGCGIDPEQLAQVSDPFFTTRREAGGVGLGLSVSDRIMREHQGQLLIDSTPGKGSEFCALLPVWDEEN